LFIFFDFVFYLINASIEEIRTQKYGDDYMNIKQHRWYT